MQQNEMLDKVIEYLQSLKNNSEVTINIIPPHIEEIFNTFNKTYGKAICKIEIEDNILYTKKKTEMFDKWKRIK